MTAVPLQVRRVLAEDWQELRRVRLAAMSDAPDAFGSTYERELSFDEAGWLERIARSPWWLAWDGARAIGVIAAYTVAPDAVPDDRHVVSMWVDPSTRGTGVADALMEALTEWAIGDGARTLSLWVVESNERARRFYERHGFEATPRRAPLPSDNSLSEVEMIRVLTAGEPF